MIKKDKIKWFYGVLAVVTLLALSPVICFAQDTDESAVAVQASVEADEQDSEIKEEIDYNSVLSFPITEEKMKAFVLMADKINRVNRKWDMQISGAETDTMAVEYMNLSNEEMADVMENISGITLDEYNEIFEFATRNKEFKIIVDAFKLYYVDAPRKARNQDSSSGTSLN